LGVLDSNGNSNNWRYRVLHDSDVMGIFSGSEGSLLHEILIDTDEGDCVTTWDLWDSFGLSSHHNNGSLNVLNMEIGLGSRSIVWSLDSNFLSGGNGTSENSTESVESTLIVSRDHLGDEDAKWTVWIAFDDGFVSGIISWSFIKISSSVLLGLDWGWELEDDHFKKSLSSIDPLLENVLHEMLSLEFSIGSLKGDTEGKDHLIDFFHLTVHGGSAKSDDWLHHELNESSLEFRTISSFIIMLPCLSFLIEVVITPKFLLHLISIDTELLGVDLSETCAGEGPSEKSGTESGCSINWINLLGFTHIIALIGGDDNVDVFDDLNELLIHLFSVNLEFEDTSINLVDHEDWLNFFSKSLSQHGFGLDGNTLNVIDDDKGTIGDSKSSSDFR